jgi:rod shape-determining protein MreC
VARRGRPYNRLSSFSFWTRRFSLLILLCAGIGFIVIDRVETPWARQARAAVTDVFTPIIDTVSAPFHAVSDWFDSFESNSEARRKNAVLKRAMEALKIQLQEKAALAEENKRLRSLLNVGKRYSGKHITARVIADPGGAYVRAVLINAGEVQGVRRGLAVINASGLVGRVVEVGARTSRVMLITDLNSRLPVMLGKSGRRAVLVGANGRLMRIAYLPPHSPVELKSLVLTSGHGGVLPRGIPIGRVERIDNGVAKIRPLVDWNQLSYVRVIDFTTPGLVGDGKAGRAGTISRRPVEQPGRAGTQ